MYKNLVITAAYIVVFARVAASFISFSRLSISVGRSAA